MYMCYGLRTFWHQHFSKVRSDVHVLWSTHVLAQPLMCRTGTASCSELAPRVHVELALAT
jgi:hypothetical protein